LPELTVIFWRSVPAQVTATDGSSTARASLSDRFEKAIDAAAMKAGLLGQDEYLAEWRRVARPCGHDLEREATEEVARIESAFTTEVLRRLVRSGGAGDDPGE
jgi:hypothetical protein